MSREVQPPVPISLLKIELPTVIKNELPESEIVEIGIDDILDSLESEEEIISYGNDIDIVYHPVCDESIKSEILESKHCESMETQVLVKGENSPFIKTENITQRNKTEDTSDENVTGQAVVEVQDSNVYSNVLSNLETDAQLVLNFSKDLNGISTRTRKAKQPVKTKFAKCYKTVETTSWEKDEEKIKVIKAPAVLVEPQEYTSLAKDMHICNHCQHACNALNHLKRHIKKIHREVITMYQCPYCTYKSKWKEYIINQHIILKHKHAKDIHWFQCNLCEMKFKLKFLLTRHMKVHLKHKQMQDGLDLHKKRFDCNKCNYKTYTSTKLKNHELTHLKPEEIQYFYCYHCSYKSKYRMDLKKHIFKQHFKKVKQEKRFGCNKCNYKTYTSTKLKSHKLTHLKPEESQYFYCYHCSFKSKYKNSLKTHIFTHFKKGQVEFDCYICNFVTSKTESIIKHIEKHSKVQNKSEIK